MFNDVKPHQNSSYSKFIVYLLHLIEKIIVLCFFESNFCTHSPLLLSFSIEIFFVNKIRVSSMKSNLLRLCSDSQKYSSGPLFFWFRWQFPNFIAYYHWQLRKTIYWRKIVFTIVIYFKKILFIINYTYKKKTISAVIFPLKHKKIPP